MESAAGMPALYGLMNRFGGYRTWLAGLDVLGWPPTWNPSTQELLKIQTNLERNLNNGDPS